MDCKVRRLGKVKWWTELTLFFTEKGKSRSKEKDLDKDSDRESKCWNHLDFSSPLRFDLNGSQRRTRLRLGRKDRLCETGLRYQRSHVR